MFAVAVTVPLTRTCVCAPSLTQLKHLWKHEVMSETAAAAAAAAAAEAEEEEDSIADSAAEKAAFGASTIPTLRQAKARGHASVDLHHYVTRLRGQMLKQSLQCCAPPPSKLLLANLIYY